MHQKRLSPPPPPPSPFFMDSCSRRQSPLKRTSTPPQTVTLKGRSFITPSGTLSRLVVMGNSESSDCVANPPSACQQNEKKIPDGSQSPQTSRPNTTAKTQHYYPVRPASNLTVLLNQHEQQQQQEQQQAIAGTSMLSSSIRQTAQQHSFARSTDEADSASGPPMSSGSFASMKCKIPESQHITTGTGSLNSLKALYQSSIACHPPQEIIAIDSIGAGQVKQTDHVRRCMSSKELGTLAPPSGSPYAYMLHKKEQLEISMRQRLIAIREAVPSDPRSWAEMADESSSVSSKARERGNEMRNRRRAQHNQVVVEDLCHVVTDLFIAESKLLQPLNYGVPSSTSYEREKVLGVIRSFVSALPNRYALGADTPSEVLLHMRLMATARSDKTKAVVHIHNLADDNNWNRNITAVDRINQKSLRLVTISCADVLGLLEYITKLLASSGSRVLDADVMLSTDGIVLDRFVVEMNGRLRLDKFANMIEAFLKERHSTEDAGNRGLSFSGPTTPSPMPQPSSGSLYYKNQKAPSTAKNVQDEIDTAVPLSKVLGSMNNASHLLKNPTVEVLRRLYSASESISAATADSFDVVLPIENDRKGGVSIPSTPDRPNEKYMNTQSLYAATANTKAATSENRRRQLVNRRACSDLDAFEEGALAHSSASTPKAAFPEPAADLDYVTIPNSGMGRDKGMRNVPIIPFEELMLIETLGSGRVSTIYRAAWQRISNASFAPAHVQMVALKVAMVDHITGGTSHVDELRREADIAARLSHPNVCDLVGVAADQDCFCLAFDFCEGGSLLSLLSDSSRFYEYLPIALDIANGMAYLHSRNVIHRDLKPSNILLTRDHRAKIADFGMSVANTGQELTAETGTYRYMAPEVIRHESYSSNADVYSFGLCLWQLITREVPFATLTPIQAAYAVAEGRRPSIPSSVPQRLQDIIMACWDQDSNRRPSFTYIAMALADYAKMAFSPANVGTLTLQIANEMLATVEGNSNVNVDFSTHTVLSPSFADHLMGNVNDNNESQNIGLEIE